MTGFGGCRLRHHRLGGEVEGDAHDVGIFDVEQAVLVQLIGLAAQAAADHLLAQELGAEGADAEDVGDGVGVPAFGQHRHRDDAADLLAEPARAADGVHHLAQQLAVADLRPAPPAPSRCDQLALELLDLRAGQRRGSPCPALRRIRSGAMSISSVLRAGKAVAVLVVVAEQLEWPAWKAARSPSSLAALEAGDPFEDQLGDRGVLAHDDEHRRHADAGALPALELSS